MMSGPEVYTEGLGEVIRGFRLYTGLSRAAMAAKLSMSVRSYERIEDGRRACPPGLLDSLRDVVVEFDHDVDQIVDASREGSAPPVTVSVDVPGEWRRCVANRAAMTGEVRPVLIR